MANFRIYPGLFVRVTRDFEDLKEGQILQVLNIRWSLSFVGVNGNYPTGAAGQWLEPIYKKAA